VIVDAIVLAGGRSSRLGSVAKAELLVEGRSLLARTLDAAAVARRIVVVGPEKLRLPAGVLHAREEPAFAGPAAGIAAGLDALDSARATSAPSEAVLVLACDMPHLDQAMPRLLRGLVDNPETDGVIAVDEGQHLQPLAAGYRTSALTRVLAHLAAARPLADLPAFRLLDTLYLTPIDVPEGSTADVDTWEDARRLGVEAPAGKEQP
jgi:molybdopterin-guanine dinucleotide biosynthesis protein A